MTPTMLLRVAEEEGVSLSLTPTGTIKAAGNRAAVARWMPMIRENKPGIIAALQSAANDAMTEPAKGCPVELFVFTPPNDPANDDEALQERVGIMMAADNMDDATALREARWQADKERCWRTFLRNSRRVAEAPESDRERLLSRYETEATARYGAETASNMAQSLASWVRGGVH